MKIDGVKLFNFRELGGYPNKDGRKVRSGIFYRGIALHNVCQKDKELIEALKIRHIIDLRSSEEANIKPGDFVPSGADYVQISANRLSHERRCDNLDFSDVRQEKDVEEWLVQAYRYFPFENTAYQKVFQYLREEEVPIYFHCASGKDRTGACAAFDFISFGCSERNHHERLYGKL